MPLQCCLIVSWLPVSSHLNARNKNRCALSTREFPTLFLIANLNSCQAWRPKTATCHSARTNNTIWLLYNWEFPVFAYPASCFTCTVYSFNSGHFASTILRSNLPFKILLACNPYAYGCAIFEEFTKCPCILPSAAALLDHIRGSGDNGFIDGYLIHSHHYQTSEPTSAFWNLQIFIVIQLQSIRKLRLFVAFVHSDQNNHCVSKFISQLSAKGWFDSQINCSFPDYGDSTIGATSVVVGIHTNTYSSIKALLFQTPPLIKPRPLAAFVWQPFNKKEFSLSSDCNDPSFANGSMPTLQALLPSASVLSSVPTGLLPLYYLHQQGSDTCILNSAAVLSPNSLLWESWLLVARHSALRM